MASVAARLRGLPELTGEWQAGQKAQGGKTRGGVLRASYGNIKGEEECTMMDGRCYNEGDSRVRSVRKYGARSVKHNMERNANCGTRGLRVTNEFHLKTITITTRSDCRHHHSLFLHTELQNTKVVNWPPSHQQLIFCDEK
ncbi:hypothetical protein E2C01_085796 [Portunus trituberculatus]|uniref:Uncharacterized protein n=1 Tax=Portunus trituberculatus TaxID=210409 RepID=A0A5B7J7T7_PORTR|nr:hypothetical protein [Portunus trituberculatus]